MAEVCGLVPDAYDELSTFLSTYHNLSRYRKEFWLRRFEYWWENNPAFCDDFPRGWLIRDRNQILGFLGCIPSYFQLLAEKKVALNATMWRVLPEYRNQSIRLLFNLINNAKDSIIFSTTPTEDVVRILKAFNFHLLPRESQSKSILILNPKKAFKEKLGDKWFFKSARFGLFPILKILDSLRFVSSKGINSVTVKEVSEANTEFTSLWERTKSVYANTNVRTADVLNWYCFGLEDLRKHLFAAYKNEQLVGFAIFRRNNDRTFKKLESLDLWMDPKEKYVVESLICFALRYGLENSYDKVEFSHFTSYIGRYLLKLKPLQIITKKRRDYYRVGSEMMNKLTKENTYVVSFQGDYSL